MESNLANCMGRGTQPSASRDHRNSNYFLKWPHWLGNWPPVWDKKIKLRVYHTQGWELQGDYFIKALFLRERRRRNWTGSVRGRQGGTGMFEALLAEDFWGRKLCIISAANIQPKWMEIFFWNNALLGITASYHPDDTLLQQRVVHTLIVVVSSSIIQCIISP